MRMLMTALALCLVACQPAPAATPTHTAEGPSLPPTDRFCDAKETMYESMEADGFKPMVEGLEDDGDEIIVWVRGNLRVLTIATQMEACAVTKFES